MRTYPSTGTKTGHQLRASQWTAVNVIQFAASQSVGFGAIATPTATYFKLQPLEAS